MPQVSDLHKINPKLTDVKHTAGRITSDFLINRSPKVTTYL